MRGGLSIRAAQRRDRRAILVTVGAAFAGGDHDGSEEIGIVEAVWSRHAGVEGLDLVAIHDEEVVGHVLASWGDLDGRPHVGIAPLSVRPEYQRVGVGTALMREVVRRADVLGLTVLFVLGNPGYYGRFGFEPTESVGVWYGPAGRDNPHFMVRPLTAFSQCPDGEYRYAWESPT